jgi:hypothetical protein
MYGFRASRKKEFKELQEFRIPVAEDPNDV